MRALRMLLSYSCIHVAREVSRSHVAQQLSSNALQSGLQAENSSTKQLDLIKINEGTKRNLEQEIQGFKIDAQKQQRLVFQLEQEREKYGQEASESTAKYMKVRFCALCCLLRPAGARLSIVLALLHARVAGLAVPCAPADNAPPVPFQVSIKCMHFCTERIDRQSRCFYSNWLSMACISAKLFEHCPASTSSLHQLL